MKQKLMFLGLMGLAAISAQAGEETAWARKNVDNCKKEMAKTDESTFESKLSAYSYQQYMMFSPEEKKKAMDYADNNAMSPDDAVMKVMSNR